MSSWGTARFAASVIIITPMEWAFTHY